uniref:NAD(P)/FAD-dependent oxidoreductase n=1 Tax=Phascolarctobacterium sp. TaxID=2049039 RepID=UPI00386CD8E3
MSKVVIIGAGAAGLLAGITAAQNGADVTILEKMRQPGKKMLITGKGRCNITNACEIPEFIKNLPGNGRFLNSALHRFTNDDIVIMLESNGLQTKVERGNRVFPVSDKAKDVVDTLTKIYTQAGGKLLTDTKALEILIKDGRAVGVKTINGVYPADAVILCAGGASYPGTGSDGGGAKLAAKAGHSIVPLKPSLVPLTSDYPYVDDLQGLSLRNVEATLFADGKKIASEFGEMLFTHFGVSGPIILSLSNAASKAIADGKEVELSLDLKPALRREKLDARIQRDFKEYSRKQLANGMKDLLPQRLIPVVCDMAYLDEEKFINQISREERLRLLDTLKG